MNVLMPPQRRVWLPVSVALALVAAGFSLWITAPRAGTRSLGAGNTDAAPPAGGIGKLAEEATWKVKVVPAKVDRPITRAQKKAVAANQKVVSSTVTAVVDASLLDGVSLKALSGKTVTEGVANALARAHLGAPQGADGVVITRRAAYIGIDPISARRAAAEVAVGFKARVEGRGRRFSQHFTLWLTKSSEGWQVSAFAGDRSVVKQTDGKAKAHSRAKNGDGKRGNKESGGG